MCEAEAFPEGEDAIDGCRCESGCEGVCECVGGGDAHVIFVEAVIFIEKMEEVVCSHRRARASERCEDAVSQGCEAFAGGEAGNLGCLEESGGTFIAAGAAAGMLIFLGDLRH